MNICVPILKALFFSWIWWIPNFIGFQTWISWNRSSRNATSSKVTKNWLKLRLNHIIERYCFRNIPIFNQYQLFFTSDWWIVYSFHQWRKKWFNTVFVFLINQLIIDKHQKRVANITLVLRFLYTSVC